MSTNIFDAGDQRDFDPVPYLRDEASIEAYLSGVMASNHPVLLALAMIDVGRARALNALAQFGSKESQPRVSTR